MDNEIVNALEALVEERVQLKLRESLALTAKEVEKFQKTILKSYTQLTETLKSQLGIAVSWMPEESVPGAALTNHIEKLQEKIYSPVNEAPLSTEEITEQLSGGYCIELVGCKYRELHNNRLVEIPRRTWDVHGKYAAGKGYLAISYERETHEIVMRPIESKLQTVGNELVSRLSVGHFGEVKISVGRIVVREGIQPALDVVSSGNSFTHPLFGMIYTSGVIRIPVDGSKRLMTKAPEEEKIAQ